jgi:hypothetical protein
MCKRTANMLTRSEKWKLKEKTLNHRQNPIKAKRSVNVFFDSPGGTLTEMRRLYIKDPVLYYKAYELCSAASCMPQ